MSSAKPNVEISFLIGLVFLSTVLGWFVPTFYEWTDSDQSRPSPWLWAGPLGLAAIGVVVCCILPFIRMHPGRGEVRTEPVQFQLRWLLGLTAVIAGAIAIGIHYPTAIANLAVVFAMGLVIWEANARRTHLPRVLSLIGCMMLPFSWFLVYIPQASGFVDLVMMFPTLPGLLGGGIVGNLFRVGFHESQWIAVLFTALELTVGIVMIRLGARRTIAYLIFVMIASLTNSVFLNALVRI